jgi:hypothetical protein
MVQAYPIQWPKNYPRAEQRKRSSFQKCTPAKCREEVTHEVKLLGGKDLVISTNVPINKDGSARSGWGGAIDDPGVAAYFSYKGKLRVIACDKWITIEENLRAIYLTISAQRGIGRWGTAQMMDATFDGMLALPDPKDFKSEGKRYFDDCKTMEEVRARYKNLAMAEHPDQEGNNNAFVEILQQYDQAKSKFN